MKAPRDRSLELYPLERWSTRSGIDVAMQEKGVDLKYETCQAEWQACGDYHDDVQRGERCVCDGRGGRDWTQRDASDPIWSCKGVTARSCCPKYTLSALPKLLVRALLGPFASGSAEWRDFLTESALLLLGVLGHVRPPSELGSGTPLYPQLPLRARLASINTQGLNSSRPICVYTTLLTVAAKIRDVHWARLLQRLSSLVLFSGL